MPSLRERKRSNLSEVAAASSKSSKKLKIEHRKGKSEQDTLNATKDVSPGKLARILIY